MARALWRRLQLIEQVADSLCHMQVGALVPSANVVGFADAAVLDHGSQGLGMVLNVEPVAYVEAVTIDRQFPVGQALDDQMRD